MTPEYIEKMKAIFAIKRYEFGHCPEYMQDWATKLKRAILEDITDDVMEIPAADVAPVVHGRWSCDSEDGFDNYDWHCDMCGGSVGYRCGNPVFSKYCPNCGARMDGE